MFNISKFESYVSCFPENVLKTFCDSFPFISSDALRSQLRYIYREFSKSNLKGIYELYKVLVSENIDDVLSEASKAMNVFLTMSVTSCETERTFSALKRIKTFTRNKMSNHRLSNLSLLSIEKTRVANLLKNAEFISDVIEHFATISPRRVDFLYK